MAASKMRFYTPLLALAILFTGCQDDDENKRVVTLDPIVVNNRTVQLRALFNPVPYSGQDYGFVLDVLPGPDYETNKVWEQGSLSNSELTVERHDLFQGQTYYVRGYIKNGTSIEYGEEKTFVFGGLTPEIKDVLQDTGHWGDTVKIVGKNFIRPHRIQFVQFGDLISEITDASADTITCIVPFRLNAGQHAVKVTIGSLSSNTIPFTLAAPEIVNISPSSGTFFDLVVISGAQFHKTKTGNKVRFGAIAAEIVQATANEITVRVPATLRESTPVISVQVDSQRVDASTPFVLLPMTVSSVNPGSERIGNVITIQGLNFSPSKFHNDVLFDNNIATVVEASASQLKVQVPNGIYADRNTTVSIKVAGQTQQAPFEIKNAWIRKADIPSGRFGRYGGEAFSVNGVGYAGLGGGAGPGSAHNDFYRFNEQTNTWTRIADFAGGKRYWAASFVIGNIAYVGTGSVTTLAEGTNDFYKYDPASDTWSRIADFPGAPATQAVGFSAHGKGYLCLTTEQDNFWEYDPALDVWTKKSTLVTSPWGGRKRATGAFVLQNRAFVVTSLHSSGELYEYDFANNAWITKNNMSGMTANLPVVVTTNSAAYHIVGYSAIRYDLDNDRWHAVDFDPVPTRNDAFIFSIGEKLFLGGGREGDYVDLWECDTSRL